MKVIQLGGMPIPVYPKGPYQWVDNHPVCADTVRRLAHYVGGLEADVSDFLALAGERLAVSDQTSDWSLSLRFDLERRVQAVQHQLASTAAVAPTQALSHRTGLWHRLLSAIFGLPRTPPATPRQRAPEDEMFHGFSIASYEATQRPFEIAAANSADAVAAYEKFLALKADDREGVQTMIRHMLQEVERAVPLPAGLPREVRQAIEACYPLADALAPKVPAGVGHEGAAPEGEKPGPAERARTLRVLLDFLRGIWTPTEGGTEIESPWGVRKATAEFRLYAPAIVVDVMQALLPSWEGLSTHSLESMPLPDDISAAFRALMLPPSALFPNEFAGVFEGLSAQQPNKGDESLIAYVPPENVKALVALLERHRPALNQVWTEEGCGSSRAIAFEFAALYEPACYAKDHGLGFMQSTGLGNYCAYLMTESNRGNKAATAAAES